MKDSILGDVLWYKFITKKETLADYKEGIEWILSSSCETQAIIADGFKGLRQLCPQILFQLCRFHQVQFVLIKLTNHPKLQPSIKLLEIAKLLCHTDKPSFVGKFNSMVTAMGQPPKRAFNRCEDGKSHYTHKNLSSAFMSLKNNLPSLRTWHEHIHLKKTT